MNSNGPSLRQILIYDNYAQNFAFCTLFIGLPSLCFGFYGLFSNDLSISVLNGLALLFALYLAEKVMYRFWSLQNIFENGETVRLTINNIGSTGGNLLLGGKYSYNKKHYTFSTSLQKTSRTKKLAVGDQVWLVVDQDNPEDAFIRDLYIPDSPDEIRQTFVPDEVGKIEQSVIPDHYAQKELIQQTLLSWSIESGDDVFEESIENPNESEITKLIQDVYDQKVLCAILKIDEEKNWFMQIGYGGAGLEFCVGPDGPVYGVDAVHIEIATKCFLSYNAGDGYWKTAIPWKLQTESIKALESVR